MHSEEVIDSRIRGSIADLIHPDEIDELVEEGLLSDRMSDVYCICNFARKVLFHLLALGVKCVRALAILISNAGCLQLLCSALCLCRAQW
jgi:hypothetical protein